MNIQIIVVCKECHFRMEQTNIDFDNSVLVTVKPCVNGCGQTTGAVDLGDSAALEVGSTPEVLSAGQGASNPAPNH